MHTYIRLLVGFFLLSFSGTTVSQLDLWRAQVRNEHRVLYLDFDKDSILKLGIYCPWCQNLQSRWVLNYGRMVAYGPVTLPVGDPIPVSFQYTLISPMVPEQNKTESIGRWILPNAKPDYRHVQMLHYCVKHGTPFMLAHESASIECETWLPMNHDFQGWSYKIRDVREYMGRWTFDKMWVMKTIWMHVPLTIPLKNYIYPHERDNTYAIITFVIILSVFICLIYLMLQS
jgi:hypothetical protein